LARQAWSILQNPETLSARILKAVYFPTTGFLEASVGSHPSQVWRSLVEGRDAMKQGLIRRIGTGTTTHAWNDNWIPRDFLLRPMPSKKDNPPTHVSSFIAADSVTWNMEALEESFQPMDIEQICRIPLSTRQYEDTWSWHYERSGVLSVRSVYRLLVNTRKRREDWLEGRPATSNQAAEEKLWHKMWKIQVPSKLRLFLWWLA
jgi:hypothetical protein